MALMLRIKDHVQGQEMKTINELTDAHPNICDRIVQELSREKQRFIAKQWVQYPVACDDGIGFSIFDSPLLAAE